MAIKLLLLPIAAAVLALPGHLKNKEAQPPAERERVVIRHLEFPAPPEDLHAEMNEAGKELDKVRMELREVEEAMRALAAERARLMQRMMEMRHELQEHKMILRAPPQPRPMIWEDPVAHWPLQECPEAVVFIRTCS